MPETKKFNATRTCRESGSLGRLYKTGGVWQQNNVIRKFYEDKGCYGDCAGSCKNTNAGGK